MNKRRAFSLCFLTACLPGLLLSGCSALAPAEGGIQTKPSSSVLSGETPAEAVSGSLPTASVTAANAATGANTAEAADATQADSVAEGYTFSSEATDYVDILMNSGAHIVVKLRSDVAPISVKNFQTLVGDGFYDGLIFHRVIEGFMIQGGDPDGTGMGGSSKNIKGEFSSNGVKNPLSHKRGVLSMARANDPNSASSQFFIVHQDSTFLDGNYAAFGEVVYGMDEVDRIATVATNAQDRPTTEQVMTKVFFVKPQ